MRLIIAIYFVSISTILFSQVDVEIGKHHSGEVIIAQKIQFGSHVVDLDYDSTSDNLIIQLREVRGKKEVFKNTGELVVIEASTLRRKWSRPINYLNESIVISPEHLLFRQADKSQYLDFNTGQILWESETLIHSINSEYNVGIGYNNRKSNLLEGVYLPFGNTIWSRTVERKTGWKEYFTAWDSTMIISADALHTINLMTGTGWDLDIQTFKKDYKKMVGMGALAVATGILTGFAVLPSGPDYVGPIHSNLLVNDSSFYIASQNSLNKFNSQSDTLWTAGKFSKQGSRSYIFRQEDDIILVNYGHANKLYKKIPFGEAFIARFDSNGRCEYKIPIISENLINDLVIDNQNITFLTSTELITHSLVNGQLKKIKTSRTEGYKGFSQFWHGKLLNLTNDSTKAELVNELKILTGNRHILQFEQDFNFIEQFEVQGLLKEYYTEPDFSFYKSNSQIYVMDNNLNQIAKMGLDMNYKTFGKCGEYYFNTIDGYIYRFKLEKDY